MHNFCENPNIKLLLQTIKGLKYLPSDAQLLREPRLEPREV